MSRIKIRPEWREVKPETTYVYIHRRDTDGTPFYVGIGTGKRAWEVGTGRKTDKRSEWWRRVAMKTGVRLEISQEGLSRDDAKLLEMWLIAMFRHQGHILCNLTDGGDGCTGTKTTDDAKAKIGKANGKAVFCSDGSRYYSASEAARELRARGFVRANHSTISLAASGKSGSAYGMSWWYEGNSPVEYVPRYERAAKSLGKSVVRSDGAVFVSTGMAAEHMKSEGFPSAHQVNIAAAARGKRATAYGYTWEYV